MDLRGVRSLKTKWVQNTSPEVMNSVFPKANFFLGHPVYLIHLVLALSCAANELWPKLYDITDISFEC